MEFIAKSPISQKILNTLRVSANLPVNILIWGEPGTGKQTLVETVFKDITTISVDEVKEQLPKNKDIYIYDLHKCMKFDSMMEQLKEHRVIATSNEYNERYEDYFPILLHIPPLKDRPEDLEFLQQYYIKEVNRDFDIQLDSQQIKIDLSQNAISLKRSIFTYAVLSSLNEEQIMDLLQRQLEPRLEEGYKNLLYLFEVPLLRAAKKRFRSVLAISKALGLNRATVTSKINRYKGFIE